MASGTIAAAEPLLVENLIVETPQRRIVDGVDLIIEPGRIAALLGPNGAGKSELVLALAGVMPATGVAPAPALLLRACFASYAPSAEV